MAMWGESGLRGGEHQWCCWSRNRGGVVKGGLEAVDKLSHQQVGTAITVVVPLTHAL